MIEAVPTAPSKEAVFSAYAQKLIQEANNLTKSSFDAKIKEINKLDDFKPFIKELPKNNRELNNKANELKLTISVEHQGRNQVVKMLLNIPTE